jgi:hypothetical protein
MCHFWLQFTHAPSLDGGQVGFLKKFNHESFEKRLSIFSVPVVVQPRWRAW